MVLPSHWNKVKGSMFAKGGGGENLSYNAWAKEYVNIHFAKIEHNKILGHMHIKEEILFLFDIWKVRELVVGVCSFWHSNIQACMAKKTLIINNDSTWKTCSVRLSLRRTCLSLRSLRRHSSCMSQGNCLSTATGFFLLKRLVQLRTTEFIYFLIPATWISTLNFTSWTFFAIGILQ